MEQGDSFTIGILYSIYVILKSIFYSKTEGKLYGERNNTVI